MASKIISKELIIQNSEGDIIGAKTEKAVSTFSDEPAFIKVYLNAIGMLTGLPEGAVGGVLRHLLQYATYASEGQLVILNPDIRKKMMNDLGMSRTTLFRNFVKLEEAGIIHGNDFSKQQRYNTILINPLLFGKGSWKEVKKLRMELILDANGTGKLITALNDNSKASGLKWDWNKQQLSLIFKGEDNNNAQTKTTWTTSDKIKDFTPQELANMKKRLNSKEVKK